MMRTRSPRRRPSRERSARSVSTRRSRDSMPKPGPRSSERAAMAAVEIPRPAAGGARAQRHPEPPLLRAIDEVEVVAEAVPGAVATGSPIIVPTLADLLAQIHEMMDMGAKESSMTPITHQDRQSPSSHARDPRHQASRLPERLSRPSAHRVVQMAAVGAVSALRDEGHRAIDRFRGINHISLSRSEVRSRCERYLSYHPPPIFPAN